MLGLSVFHIMPWSHNSVRRMPNTLAFLLLIKLTLPRVAPHLVGIITLLSLHISGVDAAR